MKPTAKIILIGVILAIAGAALLDYGIKMTGFTALLIGLGIILLGPEFIDL